MASKKVLVAEDDRFLAKAYRHGLEKAGFDLVIASDGEEAVKKIKSEKPVLVLLDLVMPNKTGFQVLEEIHVDEEVNKIPIIVLSNLGQDSDVEKAQSLGAVDYMIKANITMSDIVAKVKTYLDKAN
ncbi:MAG: response regulator [bacterium]|nr:response regulator [bacterium]